MYQNGTGVEQFNDTALEWYRKMIVNGDMDGWWLMGNVYMDMERYIDAAECYEKAASVDGNFKYMATYSLANLYRLGNGRAQNYGKALELLHRTAEHGVAVAMRDLAKMFYNGERVKNDYDCANYWNEKAAAAGDTVAMCDLGITYQYGIGVEIDLEKAKALFYQALDNGNEDAFFIIGRMYYDAKEYDKALEDFQRAAVEGNYYQDEAENYIGDMYRFAEGVEENIEEAMKWYHKSAEHGCKEAMCSLGCLYWDGEDVNEDKEKAFHWTLQAASRGVPLSMSLLGLMYEEGDVVEQDYTAAAAWYQKALDEGEEDALSKLGRVYYYQDEYEKSMHFLQKAVDTLEDGRGDAEYWIALLYRWGLGRKKDIEKAVEWFEKAAEDGDESAMFELGDIFSSGKEAVVDIKKAKKWFNMAMKAGCQEAKERLVELP